MCFFTGYDAVVFTFTTPQLVFARVVASILSRWPDALVADLDERVFCPKPLTEFSSKRMPVGAGQLLLCRDETMVQHMDDAGYVPMPDGDGPFAVMTRIRRAVDFEMTGLDELCSKDEVPSVVGPPNPYPASLCTPLLYEVTVVLPDDPAEHQFSSYVLRKVKLACTGPA